MHLVLANQWYPPESGWGGVAMWNVAMAHAFRDLGHRITVIAARSSEIILRECEADGICVQRLFVRDPYRWRRLPILGRYVRPVQKLLYALRVDRALRELFARDPFDVVEFAEVNAEGFFFAREPIAPFVVRCHTPTFMLKCYYTAREMPYDTRLISWCEKDLIVRANALTTPSNDLATIIANECHLPVGVITVIPNALSISQFAGSSNVTTNHNSNVVTILHVGRLERAKGVSVLAQAVPMVLRQVPNARFVFVGDDRPTGRGTSQRAELQSQFAQAGVNSQVEFTGAVDQAALVDWYRRADICVVPSILYESFSYTCAQAMAMGKPVVATRIGGILETVDHGVSGLIVEPGNVEQLADALVRLAQDAGLRMRFGNAGREKVVRQFDPIRIAEQNLKVYERAAETFKHSTRRI